MANATVCEFGVTRAVKSPSLDSEKRSMLDIARERDTEGWVSPETKCHVPQS